MGSGETDTRAFGPREGAALLLLCAALAYLVWKSVVAPDPELDFRYLWTAGRLWADDGDPYSAIFPAAGRRLFPTGNVIFLWVYPPQWWLICRPLAAFEVDQAVLLWRVINVALLMAGGCVLLAALKRVGWSLPLWASATFLAVLALSEATPQTLALGQTSILIFFGFALLSHALLTGSAVTMTLALILLWLKPQFGAAVTLPLLLLSRWWKAIAVAGLFSLVSALPQLAVHGLAETASGLRHNLGEYGRFDFNLPWRMTGLTQIVALPVTATMVLAALAGAGSALVLRYRRDTTANAALALTLIAASLFFLPLHSYDFVMLPLGAPLAILFGRPARIALLASVLIAFRPTNIALSLTNTNAVELGIFTLAAALLALGAGLAVR